MINTKTEKKEKSHFAHIRKLPVQEHNLWVPVRPKLRFVWRNEVDFITSKLDKNNDLESTNFSSILLHTTKTNPFSCLLNKQKTADWQTPSST